MPAHSFTQTLNFFPEQLPTVPDKDYKLAIRVLEETYRSVTKDNNNYVYADYWNLAYAYTLAQQSPETITDFLLKSQQLDPETFATVFHSSGATVAQWKEILPTKVFAQLSATNQTPADGVSKNQPFALNTEKERYSPLQCKLISISNSDQQYRNSKDGVIAKQRKLDLINQREIDQLFAEYGTYLGVDLVGKKLATVMWSVIQHSNLEMMKRYLPVIHQATKAKQLPGEGPLKLLVDRVSTLENGFQIFGSQAGVPVADQEQVASTLQEYGFRRIASMNSMPPVSKTTISRLQSATAIPTKRGKRLQ